MIKAKDDKDLDNLYLWRNGLDTWMPRKSHGSDPGYDLLFFFYFIFVDKWWKVRNRKRERATRKIESMIEIEIGKEREREGKWEREKERERTKEWGGTWVPFLFFNAAMQGGPSEWRYKISWAAVILYCRTRAHVHANQVRNPGILSPDIARIAIIYFCNWTLTAIEDFELFYRALKSP